MAGLSINAWSASPNQLSVQVVGGSAPYTVSVGGQSYSLGSSGGVLNVDDLVGGSYSVSCVDSGGTNSSTEQVTVLDAVYQSTGLSSTDTSVHDFVTSVVSDMQTVFPLGVSVLAVLVAVVLVPKVVWRFLERG